MLYVHNHAHVYELKTICSRKRRKKQHFDGQGDFSGSLRISEGPEDRVKEGKMASTDSRDVHVEQV